MKHQYEKELIQLLAESDLAPTGHEAEMVGHLEWVLDTNKHLNLTAIQSWEDGLRLHVVDSLLALHDVQSSIPGPLLDLGTGGGFPGIPLGLAAERETILLDSVAKKVKAIDAFLCSAGLTGFRTVATRAEEAALESPSSVAVVVCRAVAPLASIVELATPLLRMGGSLVALKAPLADAEYEQGLAAAELCGLDLVSRRFLSLPRGGEKREVLRFERVRDAGLKLPRRTGLAQKRPLGQ